MTPVVITKMLPLLTTLTGLALPWVSAEMAYATVASLAAVVEIDVALVANVDRRITAPGRSKAGLLNRPRGVDAGDKVVDWRKDNNRTGCPRRRRGRSKAIDSVSRRRCEHTTKKKRRGERGAEQQRLAVGASEMAKTKPHASMQ